MKRIIKLTESDLKRIVESVYEDMAEAESGGWVVDTNEVQEAYNLAVEKMGKETIDSAIIRAMSTNALADCLAYIFRMYDFREWDEYKSSREQN